MKRWLRRCCWVALALFILLNILAYCHARSFFFYSDGGARTPAPEKLTWSQKISVMAKGIHVPKPKAHSPPDAFGLTYTNVLVPGRDGMSLAGWLYPAVSPGKTAILFHGYSSEKSGLLREAAMFSDLGYRVLLVDFPGSGESPGNIVSLGMWEAEDVAAVFNWVREKWPSDQVVLYGHSMGGAAVMRAMANLNIHPDAAVIESVFDNLLNAIRIRFHLLSAPSFPAAEILLFWGSVQLGANGFAHDVADYATRINVPVIIIHGKEDNRASLSGAEKVYEKLAGRKLFFPIDEAGHVSPIMSNPVLWRETVSGYLTQAVSDK